MALHFAELVSYIEDVHWDTVVTSIFKVKDLVNLCNIRRKLLRTEVVGCAHSTRLKERLLGYFPDTDAHKQGRDLVLVSNEDVGSALVKACERDANIDAVHPARATNIVRRDMFKMKNQLSGSFGSKWQEHSVPESLLAWYGAEWTKHQSIVNFLSSATTSFHHFAATNAQ